MACFRPQGPSEEQRNRWAYRYLTLEVTEVREIIRVGLLPISIANILDEQLPPLNLSDTQEKSAG